MDISHVITSNQGSEFNNDLNAELMRSMGIDHRLTTAYHPQANGLDECFNQTLKNAKWLRDVHVAAATSS